MLKNMNFMFLKDFYTFHCTNFLTPITGIPTTFVVDPATMKVGTRVTGGLADYAAACSAF